jgi:hypothetical protein
MTKQNNAQEQIGKRNEHHNLMHIMKKMKE